MCYNVLMPKLPRPARPKRCWTCNEIKESDQFESRLGKCCRECRESGRPKWTKAKQAAARYRADRIRVLERNAQWIAANELRYRSKQKETVRKRRAERRALVLEHYGSCCACCGETEPLFLTIDHIDGSGNEHRREIGKTDMWLWLLRQGFPDGFRILCYNCNAGRYRNGGKCPHERDLQE